MAALDSLCVTCLKGQLAVDYTGFASQAIVIQPAPGPPVYVFHSSAGWEQRFSDSAMPNDVRTLLGCMDEACHDCRDTPKFVWVESAGLTSDTFAEVLERGITATLLSHNPAPICLCAVCCVERIATELRARNLSYLEVCSPMGVEPGFVLPMGY